MMMSQIDYETGPQFGPFFTQNNILIQGCAIATGENGTATVNQQVEPQRTETREEAYAPHWMTELGIPLSLRNDLYFFRPFIKTEADFRNFADRLISCQNSAVVYALLAELVHDRIFPEEVICTIDTMERIKRLVSHVDLPQPQSMKKTLDNAIKSRESMKGGVKK